MKTKDSLKRTKRKQSENEEPQAPSGSASLEPCEVDLLTRRGFGRPTRRVTIDDLREGIFLKCRKNSNTNLKSIRRGFAEIEAGHHIPHEAIKAWLLSLGSAHELLPPKCACGKSHDEPSRREGETSG